MRATLVVTLLLAGVAGSWLSGNSIAQDEEALPFHALRPLDLSCCETALRELTGNDIARLNGLVLEKTIAELTALLESGELTSYELVLFYLYRINTHDLDTLNAVIEINPEVLDLTRERDQQRDAGDLFGPLHGIPILLKDNITTEGSLHTSAGAAALSTVTSDRDAFLVTRLREAGAIILGKANLSEWANWMHSPPANGYSAVGGQVVSPYLDWLDPSGSSTGSAVAVSANLVTLSIGTETIGSIISPAARSGVVGFKPSLGLISRDLVIPITDELDTPGPIGLSVTDVAVAMTALAATIDPDDPLSPEASALIGADFAVSLDISALQGKTVGIVAFDPTLSDPEQFEMYGLWDEVAAFESAGATVIVIRPPGFPDLDYGTLFSCDMRIGVDHWFSQVESPVSTMLETTGKNDANPEWIPYGQDRLKEAVRCTMTAVETAALGASIRDDAREYMESLFAESGVDLLVSIDDLFSPQYATAGYPAISVPHGTTSEGIPSGLTLVGPYLSDVELLGYAFAFEQTEDWRVPPPLVASILASE